MCNFRDVHLRSFSPASVNVHHVIMPSACAVSVDTAPLSSRPVLPLQVSTMVLRISNCLNSLFTVAPLVLPIALRVVARPVLFRSGV